MGQWFSTFGASQGIPPARVSKIKEVKPPPGDYYPLSPRRVRLLLSKVPPEYLQGFKGVELLPRKGDMGAPLGIYKASSKTMILHSVPLELWDLAKLDRSEAERYRSYGAVITRNGGRVQVKWSGEGLIQLYRDIFLLLIGEHHALQPSTKSAQSLLPLKDQLTAEHHKQNILKRLAE